MFDKGVVQLQAFFYEVQSVEEAANVHGVTGDFVGGGFFFHIRYEAGQVSKEGGFQTRVGLLD